MNLQIFRYSKLLLKLNFYLFIYLRLIYLIYFSQADERNKLTSFPRKQIVQILKTIKTQ